MKKGVKVFISYCHKDESYKESLDTHLALMKKSDEVSTWSDRKIIPGQEWDKEISENLESADIIIFLVSADFIASDYCFDIEVKRAMERHETGAAVVVPVLVRVCDWKATPFSKLQSLPKDTNPIKKWVDEDEAWLDVVNGIRKAAEKITSIKSDHEVSITVFKGTHSKDFLAWLQDTEIQLSHRRVEQLLLEDVYVTPHLKPLNVDMEELIKPVDVEKSLFSFTQCLILGDDQMGKTSLAKYFVRAYSEGGVAPIFMDGKDIKTSKIDEYLVKAVASQYKDIDFKNFEKALNTVLILDNFESVKLNKKHLDAFVKEAKVKFSKIIFLAQDSFKYVAKDIDELDEFEYLEILPFGNLKRSEMVEKWVSLGVVEQIDEKSLYREVDELKLKLDSLVRRNVVPAKPIFVLTMLQMFEAYTPQNIELTSYGHCYQYLIYQALEKSDVKPNEIDKYLNILSEIAWAIHKNGKGLSKKELLVFFEEYKQKYVLKDKESIIIERLTGNGLLVERNEKIAFKYPYVFYFFVAKRVAESFNSDEKNKQAIRDLLSDLHREDAANIIIFISHHTKESWILDEIQLSLMEVFEDQEEATLSSESLKFMEEFIAEIPDLVLEYKEIEKVRRESDEVKDELELSNSSKEDELEPSDILVKINRTFKGIEIVGQILRNRHASIQKDLLYQMVNFSTATGLRFLQYFLEISDSSREEVVKTIEHMLKENPSIKTGDLEREARNTFLFLTYQVIFGVLIKISTSVGSKEADEIYDELEEKVGSPAIQLINQAISLQFKKELNFKKLRTQYEEFKSNPVCQRILKEIVIQHTYMFPIDYKERQQISESLGLSIQGQRLMGLEKKTKI